MLLPEVVCIGQNKEALCSLHEPTFHCLHLAHLLTSMTIEVNKSWPEICKGYQARHGSLTLTWCADFVMTALHAAVASGTVRMGVCVCMCVGMSMRACACMRAQVHRRVGNLLVVGLCASLAQERTQGLKIAPLAGLKEGGPLHVAHQVAVLRHLGCQSLQCPRLHGL